VGDDFRDGKLTLPVVLAFARGDAEEQAFWRRTLEDQEQSDADLEHAFALLARHNALDDAVAQARDYADRAPQAPQRFPASPIPRSLDDIVASRAHRAP